MSRPSSVTIIGWLAIVFGILMIFSGTFGLLVFSLTPVRPSDQPVGGVPEPFVLMAKIFDYFGVLAAVQIAVATIMIASGAAFLRLRSWARTALEVLSWLALCFLVSFGGWWLYAATFIGSAASELPELPAVVTTAFFSVLMAVGIVNFVVFSVPVVVTLRVLRGRAVREAVSGA